MERQQVLPWGRGLAAKNEVHAAAIVENAYAIDACNEGKLVSTGIVRSAGAAFHDGVQSCRTDMDKSLALDGHGIGKLFDIWAAGPEHSTTAAFIERSSEKSG